MALKAGYVGVKKNDATKLSQLPGITEIGEGLTLGDDGTLTGDAGSVVANPEETATGTLSKLQVGETVYTVPGNDNTKCYQTDDATESTIVDADYVPFFDASAASGAGAPRKSTWSNFCSKVSTKLNSVFYQRTEQIVAGAVNLCPKFKSWSDYGVTVIVDKDGIITINGTLTADIGQDNAGCVIDIDIPDGLYFFTGHPSDSNENYKFLLADENYTEFLSETGSGVGFVQENGKYKHIVIRAYNGTQFDNVVLKPMLTVSTYPDRSYSRFIPHVLTNAELSAKVVENGIITSTDDLDDIIETGIYGITTSPANAPESVTYATLIVQASSSTDIRQLILKSGEKIYQRDKGGSPAAWHNWYKFTGTVLTP